ncbi:F0F1 ATP synthase subunit delta [Globicatella sulfidifaciens]|uniref:F0F1 ATP synthase subunit delta n=1 Tax=Globicatella sulfidifaciens TaxID=136093 RepID=A0A7X8H108_9LACT|nr:F0F1 ATP synthase subunit delta [Globicatella sulfidifaciens]NLJ19288.1 F0F1 ATP synthase subunit delta [Globicatella sulfidifaciens]
MMSENETLNQTSVNESLTRNKKVKNEEDALLKKINQERIRDSIQKWNNDNPDENREHFEDELLGKIMLNMMNDEGTSLKKEQNQSEMLMITSAVPLTDEEKERIVRKFLDITKKPLRRITTVVDPSLITGVRIQSESYYYEVTGKKTLKELRRHLDRNWHY